MTQVQTEGTYAGDLSCWQSWDRLTDDPDAVLIDVRSEAEWDFVGRPDLSRLDKTPYFIAWQHYPGMRPNADFLQQVEATDIAKSAAILLLCRSGARSRHAAIALTAAGYTTCFNIADGFEGPCDDNGQRGTADGWKAAGLPWTQK